MSHANASLLATYNALVDPNLKCYFSNERVRSHLKNTGLISRRGEIIPENEYRARLARRDHKQSVRQMLAENIVHRAIDMERARQAELRQKYELDCKKELVRQIQLSRKHRACSLVTPAIDKDKVGRELTDQSWYESKDSPIFLNADSGKELSGKYARLSRVQSAKIYRPHQMNSPSKTENRRRLARPKSSHVPWTKNAKQSNLSSKNLDKTSCEITMVYYGTNNKSDQDYSVFESIDDILVMQQHCGGENVIVYKGSRKAGDTFTFESRRHQDYPLGLSFYIQGLFDSRISACCEYRHRHGIRLGGERGHFAILSVQGSKPCLRCRFKHQLRLNEYDQISGNENPSINGEEMPVVISIHQKDETRNIRVPPIKIPISHSTNSNADKKDADHLDKVNTKQISNRERSSADSTNRQSQSSRERKDSSTSTSNKIRRKTNVINRKDDLLTNGDSTSSNSDSDAESPTKTWQIIFHTSNIPMGSLQFPLNCEPEGKLKFSFVAKNPEIETEIYSIELHDFPQCFKSGRQDSFATKLKNIGLPKQIRLILDVQNEQKLDLKWHLDHIELIDPETQLHFKFLSQKWIRANEYYTFNISDSPTRLSTRNNSWSTNNSKLSSNSNKQSRPKTLAQHEVKSSNPQLSRPSSSKSLNVSKELVSVTKPNSESSKDKAPSMTSLIPYQLVVYASKSGDGEFNALGDSRIFVRFNMQDKDFELVDLHTKSCPSFESGEVKTFDIDMDIAENKNLSSLTVGYTNSDITAIKWQIEKIVLINKNNQEEATFHCDQPLVRNDLDFVAQRTFLKKTARIHSSSSSSSSSSETVSMVHQETEQQQRISMKHQLSSEPDHQVDSLGSPESPEIESRPKTRRGRDDPDKNEQDKNQPIIDETQTADVWRPTSQTNQHDENYSSDEFEEPEKFDYQASRKENNRNRTSSTTDSDDN